MTLVLQRGVRAGPLIAAAAMVLVVWGCTTIPARQFASYKDTFVQARAAGEAVLLDYGAAANQYEAIKAERAGAKPKPKQRSAPFNPSAATGWTGVDHIAIRMQAWDVVARYNALLTALAEGKAADELAAAVDGLSSSLGSFPIAAVAATATQVSVFLAPLKALALEAVREKSRRDFVAAVGQGRGLINDHFLELLRADAADFFRVRQALNDREYDPLVDEVAAIARRFISLSADLQDTAEVQGARKRLNDALARLPHSGSGLPVALVQAKAGTTGPAAAQVAELQNLAADASGLVAQALAKDAELEAYRQVLAAYVGLLDRLEQSMDALLLATEQAQPAIPRGEDLQRAVIMLREAFIAYKDM